MAVAFEFTGDNAKLLKAMEQAEARMVKLIEQNRKLKEESQNSSGKAIFSFSKLTKELASTAAGALSVRTALQLVNAELQNRIDLQNKAAEATTSLADAEADLLANLGTATRSERDEIFKAIKDISQARGVSQLMLTQVAPAVTSARGELPVSAIGSALDIAARVSPHDRAAMEAQATGLLNAAALTKSGDMMENLGFTLGLGADTQVKSIKDINEKLIPAAIGVAQHGGTAAEAGSIVSTLTSLMKDATGAIASTAALQLSGGLAEFLPQGDTFEWDARGRKKLKQRGTGLDSTEARIEFLQANPEMRERFLAQASFETKAAPSIRNLLTGGSEGDTLQDARTLKMMAATRATAEQWLAEKEADPRQQLAGLQRRYWQASEGLLLDNIVGAGGGINRGGLEQLLKSSGQGGLATTLDMKAFDIRTWAGADPFDFTEKLLHERRGRIATGNPNARERDIASANLDQVDRGRVDQLQVVIEELRKIRNNQKRVRGREADE